MFSALGVYTHTADRTLLWRCTNVVRLPARLARA